MRRSLPLLLLLCAACISAENWSRLKAHSGGALVGVLGGAAMVATGGTAALIIFPLAITGGVVVDQLLEPAPEVTVRTVTTVVQVPQPLPDGTPAKPLVHTYVDKSPDAAPPDLRLPGGLPDLPGYWERLVGAARFAGWLFVVGFVVLWVLHRRVLKRQQPPPPPP